MMTKSEAMKELPSNVMEGMTSISAVLNGGEANNRKIEKIWIDSSRRQAKSREIAFLTAKSRERGFPIEFVSSEEIERVTVGNSHGGIVAFCTDRAIPALTADTPLPRDGFFVYLDGVEDPYNFGYTLRSLYAAGVSGVILPERNWMSAAGVVARASAGTSELLPLYTADGEDAVEIFRKSGYKILCAGIRDSVSIYDEERFPFPLLLIVGGEKRGISAKLLRAADRVVRIDYGRAFRGSLSTASATAILAFELFRQNKK